jgi:membrane protein
VGNSFGGILVLLSNFASYGMIYASLGTVIALLVYLYLSAVALLLGEEMNATTYRGATDSVAQNQELSVGDQTNSTKYG